MSEELIDGYVDRGKFKSDTDFIESELKRVEELFDKVNKMKVTIQGATTLKGVTSSAEEGIKANAQLSESIKSVTSLINARFASEAKLVTVQTDFAKATAVNRLELQKQNKELKDQAALNTANTGSIERARAAVRLLNTERNKLNLYTEEGRAKQAKLNEQIDKYNAFIKKNVDLLSQQKINIGNYAGSAKIIVDAMEKARAKVEQTTKAFGTLSPEAQAATREFDSLRKITDQPQFLNISAKVGDTNAELRFFVKQLNQLEDSGMKNSAVYKDVQARLAQLTDQLGDTRAEIKALSSDTRGFDLFAGSVSFAADSMQAAAGASALFGASEKEVEDVTKNLIAIQSVANGVKGIANELTTKGTAANKAFAFVQGLVTTATNTTAAASVRLNAALKLSSIGVVIGLIGLLIVAYDKLTGATNASAESTDTFNKRIDEGTEALNRNLSRIDKATERQKILNRTKAQGDDIKTLDTESELKGISDKRLAIEKEIVSTAKEQRILNDQKIAAEKAVQQIKKQGGNIDGNAGLDILNEKLAKTNKKYVELIQQETALGTEATNTRLNQIADEKQKQFEAEKEAAGKSKELRKKSDEDAKRAREKAAQEALDLEQRNAAAIQAITIDNINEQIRQQSRIKDSETSNADEKIKANEKILNARRALAAIEYQNAIADEVKIEEGKRVVIKKSKDELLAAETVYNNKLSAIIDDAADERNRILADYLNKQKEFYAEFEKLDQDVIDKTTARYKAALEKRAEQEKAAAEQSKQLDKELNDKKVAAALQGAELIFSVGNSVYQRQLNAIKGQQDAIDKQKESELAANDQKVQSEQDKAANIAIINSRAEAQKEQLDRKSREIENKKAAFQRTQQVFEIFITTIKSVAAIKAQAAVLAANPITAPLAIKALAQIPFVIGGGGASIAALLSTPLPKFKDGLFEDYEGPGMINDGPKKEALIKADGSIELPTGKNIVRKFRKGDRVYPDAEKLMQMVQYSALQNVMQYGNVPGEAGFAEAMAKGIETKLNEVVVAIKNKKELNLTARQGGLEAMWKHGANTIKYINESTNW